MDEINEIVRDFERLAGPSAEVLSDFARINEFCRLSNQLRTTLQAFEAKIRADEADKCNDHIEKALTSERTRLHAAIENLKYPKEIMPRYVSGPTEQKHFGPMDSHNAALQRIQDLINKEI